MSKRRARSTSPARRVISTRRPSHDRLEFGAGHQLGPRRQRGLHDDLAVAAGISTRRLPKRRALHHLAEDQKAAVAQHGDRRQGRRSSRRQLDRAGGLQAEVAGAADNVERADLRPAELMPDLRADPRRPRESAASAPAPRAPVRARAACVLFGHAGRDRAVAGRRLERTPSRAPRAAKATRSSAQVDGSGTLGGHGDVVEVPVGVVVGALERQGRGRAGELRAERSERKICRRPASVAGDRRRKASEGHGKRVRRRAGLRPAGRS